MLEALKKMDLSLISNFNVILRHHDDDLPFNECNFVASGSFADKYSFFGFVEFVESYFSFDYYSIKNQVNHSYISGKDYYELVVCVEVYE